MIEVFDTRIGMLRRGMPIAAINTLSGTLKVSVRPQATFDIAFIDWPLSHSMRPLKFSNRKTESNFALPLLLDTSPDPLH